MEIILVRHAIAEERRAGLSDIDRQLTDKGKEKFAELMPELKDTLAPVQERNFMIWSSPAIRATETARFIVDALQLEQRKIKEFIYSGDFNAFADDLAMMDEDITLFVVGHEPTLSIWGETLTGKSLKFKKGAMMNFKVTDLTPLQAEILWVIKPKKK